MMALIRRVALFAILLLPLEAFAIGQMRYVSETAVPDGFALAHSKRSASIM